MRKRPALPPPSQPRSTPPYLAATEASSLPEGNGAVGVAAENALLARPPRVRPSRDRPTKYFSPCARAAITFLCRRRNRSAQEERRHCRKKAELGMMSELGVEVVVSGAAAANADNVRGRASGMASRPRDWLACE